MNNAIYEDYNDFTKTINGVTNSLDGLIELSEKNYIRMYLQVQKTTVEEDLKELKNLRYTIFTNFDNLDKLVKLNNSSIQHLIKEGQQKDNKNAEKIGAILQNVHQLSKKAMPELVGQLRESIIKASQLSSKISLAINRALEDAVNKGKISEEQRREFFEKYLELADGLKMHNINWKNIENAERIEHIDPTMEQRKEDNRNVRKELSDVYDEKKDKVAELERAVADLDLVLRTTYSYPKEEEKEQAEKNLKTVKREIKPKEISVTIEGLEKLKNSALLKENLSYIQQVLNDNPIVYSKSGGKNVGKIQELIIQVEELLEQALEMEERKTSKLSEEHEKGAKGYEGIVYATEALKANKEVISQNNDIKKQGVYAEKEIVQFNKELQEKLEKAKRDGATPQELIELEDKLRAEFKVWGSDLLYEQGGTYYRGEFQELPKEYQDIKSVLENSSALREALNGKTKSYQNITDEIYANVERGSR